MQDRYSSILHVSSNASPWQVTAKEPFLDIKTQSGYYYYHYYYSKNKKYITSKNSAGGGI
jgi:hypothetical protein